MTQSVDELSRPEPDLSPRRLLRAPDDVVVIGVGASAGGLDSFERFFLNMESNRDMAFVIIQHLDPSHESLLVELVQRYTRMQVLSAADGMTVQRSSVYVIPPNRLLRIEDGALHVYTPDTEQDRHFAVDTFFRSLAADRQDKAIGIVLSGTGSDGTLGVRAIKGAGGMVMVQDPNTARHSGMPRSAIATGLVDYILAPEDMPSKLLNFIEHGMVESEGADGEELPKATASMDSVFSIIQQSMGHDFSLYKKSTIMRRIRRRMVLNQMSDLNDYVRYLAAHDEEIDSLFREFLISVTSFFRDSESFAVLSEKVLPAILANNDPGEMIRIWVTGCATGEEAYSIAISLQECIDQADHPSDYQVFATDIDPLAIQKARLGVYPASVVQDVPPDLVERYFTQANGHYEITKRVRDHLVFSTHSIIKDPPFSNLDLVSCRNVLIYLSPELQEQVIMLLHYSLRPGGYLFLGKSESTGALDHLFTAVDRQAKVYQRLQGANAPRPRLPSTFSPHHAQARRAITGSTAQLRGLERAIQRTLLRNFTPPCVVIDEDDQVIYVHGRTGPYLELAEGAVNLDLFDLVQEGLRVTLSSAVRQARAEQSVVSRPSLTTSLDDELYRAIVTVAPINEPPALQGLLLVAFESPSEFEISVIPAESDGEDGQEGQTPLVQQLRAELEATRGQLRATIMDLERSSQDYQATTEELQASNEELQSTNEELQTSKEELQSVNEELSTVNAELESKIEQLGKANDDLNNLFSSTQVGVIFLDQNLRIQRFTPAVTQVVNLMPSDLGRPLHHFTSLLQDQDLTPYAQRVLDTLEPIQMEAETADDAWYLVRVLPYRNANRTVEGVVLTFTDITEQKLAEERLEHQLWLDNLTFEVTSRLTHTPHKSIDQAMDMALQRIGTNIDSIDYVYLSIFGANQTVYHFYEWHAPGLDSLSERLEDLDLTQFPWALNTFHRGETICVDNVDDLSDEAAAEKEIWQSLGFTSLVEIPLIWEGHLLGISGLATRTRRDWSEPEQRLLSLLGDVLIMALVSKGAHPRFELITHRETDETPPSS